MNKTDFIIGIDPGLKGAIAVLNCDGELLSLDDMPILKRTLANGKRKSHVDGVRLHGLLEPYLINNDDHAVIVYLEKVGTHSGEGPVGAFAFGEGFGIVQGVIASAGIEPRLILPQTWKKSLSLTSLDKAATTEYAQSLFPEADLYSSRKNRQGGYNPLDGRGDALLIATSALRAMKH